MRKAEGKLTTMQRRMIHLLIAVLIVLALTSVAAMAQVSFGIGVGGPGGSSFFGTGPGYYGSPYYYGAYGSPYSSYPGYYGYNPGYYNPGYYYPRGYYNSYPGWNYNPYWRSWHRW